MAHIAKERFENKHILLTSMLGSCRKQQIKGISELQSAGNGAFWCAGQ